MLLDEFKKLPYGTRLVRRGGPELLKIEQDDALEPYVDTLTGLKHDIREFCRVIIRVAHNSNKDEIDLSEWEVMKPWCVAMATKDGSIGYE
jgi:hypothetical protein